MFNRAVRNIVLAPQIENPGALELAVGTRLEELLLAPILTDLEALTSQIYQQSRKVLGPEDRESPSDSATDETESP